MSVEELAQVANTTVVCLNNTMRVLFGIPLLDKTEYVMYKLHLLPRTKCILGDGSNGAYIRPEFPYMLIDQDQWKYISMCNKEEDYCKELTAY